MNETIINGLMASGKFKMLYTAEECAEILGTNTGSVNELIKAGEIAFFKSPFRQNGKKIPIWELVQFINRNTYEVKS